MVISRILPIIGLLCVFFATSAAPAVADPIHSREYRIKAAVVYKLLKFVEWPDESMQNGNSLDLCILGTDPFGTVLETLNGQRVHGIPLNVIHFDDVQRLEHCHVVFITGPDDSEIKRFLDQASSHALLTISEGEAFTQKGGMIGLLTTNNRVRFNINYKSVQNNGLMMSSQLLRLARDVIQ